MRHKWLCRKLCNIEAVWFVLVSDVRLGYGKST